MKKEKWLQFIPVAGAIAGGITAGVMTSATSVIGIAGAVMAGALAGGIGLPVFAFGAWLTGAGLIDMAKKNGPYLVAGAAIIANACANILFIKPYKAFKKMLSPSKKENNSPPMPPLEEKAGAAKKSAKEEFKNAVESPTTASDQKTTPPPPAPKP
jgi:hypothetical protein